MKKISISTFLLAFLLFCCTSDILPIIEDCDSTLSYDNGMSDLINRTCATTLACHSAGASAGGDYTSYSLLLRDVEDFASETFNKTMPKPGATPQLTDDEIELFNCWVTNGYPEN